ncbi:hypothetical protein L1987_81937 [Smallanthus sonchifolius]|uniref:Uncharacterized protein n=1 Tax=Smallanthus sonchifolius TaxID=185202 RepID=A0ACB8YSH3_9ASTR|nr:hypothetical protein L1987_81937 [Smallanthus sonchifolius]
MRKTTHIPVTERHCILKRKGDGEGISSFDHGLHNESKLRKYECEFEVPDDFGDIGAILVENVRHKEAYIKSIVLDDGNVIFPCESWIHSKHDNPDKRIFFTDKSYLPLETPVGLKSLREKDLESLRGNGEGERKSFERIYDYDTYNDLGDPDNDSNLSRPVLESILTDTNKGFSSFKDIGSLYDEGVDMLTSDDDGGFLCALPRLIKSIASSKKSILQFETPRLNDSSRTLMFLTPTGTLRALAIELTRPPNNGKPQWKHLYTPCWDATGAWLWKLAKAHVLAHDSGHHQLVSHWLRIHGVTEPYIIATNRHLSKMHPVQRLLCPHLRYTMEINGLARLALINAGGTIETSFSLLKYSMQLSSDAYAQQWRFDHEALPADLISRGMAVEDESAPHGIKLTIEDYPFANDGLLLWDAIKQWATTYINHYYPQPNLVESDKELQAWWTEIRTVGHADKKDEPWWPQLKTQQDLIKIATTIMWVSAGHHSAVNFGQYDFAGYFPNRPTIARTKMPDEGPTAEEWEAFISKPEDVLLDCFPTQIQATKVMSVLNILSSHSPDEEYIGTTIEAAWAAEPTIKAAFEKLGGTLKELEVIIDSRNHDPNLKNITGAGLLPYQLLKPFCEPGVTGMGVPYSISI